MDDNLIEQLGIDLHAALTTRMPIEPLTNRHPELTIEDAYQDWLKVDLQPSFIGSYASAYRDRARTLKPDIFLMSHADVGSEEVSQRSWDWIRDFARFTVKNGLNAPSYYEWSVSRMAAK